MLTLTVDKLVKIRECTWTDLKSIRPPPPQTLCLSLLPKAFKLKTVSV